MFGRRVDRGSGEESGVEPGAWELLALEMPLGLAEALERHVESIRAEAPWLAVSREEVARWLLELELRSRPRELP